MTSPVPPAALAAARAAVPFVNQDACRRILEAAAPAIAAAERERCAQLAEQHHASCPVAWDDGERHPLGETKRVPFAPVLRDQP